MNELIEFNTDRLRLRQWRLVLSLLLAIVVHILVVVILPLPNMISLESRASVLEVRLAPVARPRVSPQAQLTNSLKGRVNKSKAHARQIPPKSQPTRRVEVPIIMSPASFPMERPTQAAFSPPLISVKSLIDSAKNIVRDETRQQPLSKEDIFNIEDRPILQELAKALKKLKPGETRFADGLIKIVTSSGSVYCVKPLPDIVAHGGSVEPTIVPTNCP